MARALEEEEAAGVAAGEAATTATEVVGNTLVTAVAKAPVKAVEGAEEVTAATAAALPPATL
jgi:hypothetical protein